VNRRHLLISGGAAGLGLLWGQSPRAMAGSAPRVLVFVASDEKPRSIEGKLYSSMGSLDITVFGKAKDLEHSVAELKPDAVIAPGPTLKSLGSRVTLAGQRGGAATEPYVLVTVERGVSPQSLANETVGMFGIMDRQGMKNLCGTLLGTGEQKVNTVTKYADLLPMLQFKAAKGVVLPKSRASELTSRSALKLVLTDLPHGQVGLTSVSVTNATTTNVVVSAVKGLSSEAKAALGVEGWV
jgi:hypothetical protein